MKRMKKFTQFGLIGLFVLGMALPASAQPPEESPAELAGHARAENREKSLFSLSEAPKGFIPPPLHPGGVKLRTKRIAEGVYALLSGRA